jgi:hypothetical protein
MKRYFIIIVFIGFGLLVQAQNKKKVFSLEPKMRLGVITPIEFGNTALNKYYNTPIGFEGNFTLFKLYNIEFTGGITYANYKYNQQPDFLDYEISRQTLLYGQLAYSIELHKSLDISPSLSFGIERLSHRENSYVLTRQTGFNSRIGAYLDYKLNKTFSFYSGLHLSHTNYNMEDGVSSYRKQYHSSNSLIFSLGVEFN